MPDPTDASYRRCWFPERTDGRPARFGVAWIDPATGRRRRRWFTRRRDQREVARLIEERLNAWIRPHRITWPDLYADYGRHVTGTGARHQARVADLLADFAEARSVAWSDQITPSSIETFLAGRAKTQAASTLRVERGVLAAFGQWLVSRGIAATNPAASVRVARVPLRLKQLPAARQWVRLLEVLPALDADGRLDGQGIIGDAQAWHLLILLAVTSGLRQSVCLHTCAGVPIVRPALARLEAQYGRFGGFCVVQLAGAGEVGALFSFSGKTAKERVTGLPAIVADRFAVRIGEMGEGETRLFPWPRFPARPWTRIARVAGLAGLHFRDLRAISGTLAAVAAAQAAAQLHLEHSSPRITRDHYLDPSQVAVAVALAAQLPDLPPLPARRNQVQV